MNRDFTAELQNSLCGRRLFVKIGNTKGSYSARTLAAIAMGIDADAVLSGAVFAFCSFSRKVIRLLFWEDGGYYLIERRIISRCFRWPMDKSEKDVIESTCDSIRMLLRNPSSAVKSALNV